MISVLIPTYRRVPDLDRCLAAIAAQTRPADEVIVVARDSDAQTQEYLRTRQAVKPGLRVVTVTVQGVIAAMNAGLEAAGGDLIALTDDDAAPRPDWLARIETHFVADSGVGGVGGRDWVSHGNELNDGPPATNAGQMSWYGRVTAGHHLAAGPPREVCVLKGVNCAYRAVPLREIAFDKRMAGSGAQVHWELALGLALQRAGWKLLLDPAIAVDHYPAARFDEDQRRTFSSLAVRNSVANETLVVFEHLRGWARLAFLLWIAMVGTSSAPGLLQVPRVIFLRRPHPLRLWWATLQGRVAGLRTFFKTRHRSGTGRAKSALSLTASGVHL
jgi:glycosyltransferase involved in cell wall biosynthesis